MVIKKKKKILITGVAGFIGFSLAKKIIESNNYNVIGIDNLNSYYIKKLKYKRLTLLKHKNFKFYKIDLIEKSKLFSLFKKHKFDIVFIDGLHTYDQVKKDILNSVNCLKENGIVLVHDCMPDSLSKQAVPRYRMIWNGDVWKAIVDLRQREDLEIFTCEMDQGIGIIKKEKNTSILEIKKPARNLKFKDYYANYKKFLRVISVEELKEKY